MPENELTEQHKTPKWANNYRYHKQKTVLSKIFKLHIQKNNNKVKEWPEKQEHSEREA